MIRPGRGLRAFVLVVIVAGFALPIAAGAGLTLAAALGHLPALGRYGPSLLPLQMLFGLPGLGTSLALTLFTGICSTLLALIAALGLLARVPAALRLMPPLLATPHAALALGLAFLLAPSGWLARLIALPLGWQAPPTVATVNDPAGFALMFGLAVKEMPFLLLMLAAAQARLPMAQIMATGRSLGYAAGAVWLKLVLPQLYPLVRLPVFITLAYALSVVDMALILGPGQPPTLAVAVMRGFTDPDPAMILPASAGAVLLVGLIAATIGGWRLAECAIVCTGRRWLLRGGRGRRLTLALPAALGHGLLLAGMAALLLIALWAFAFRWSFPDLWPEGLTLRGWMRGSWAQPLVMTLALALATTATALLLAVAWLEGEDRGHLPRARWAGALVLTPLLLPQIGFLFGLNGLFLRLGLAPLPAVFWAQMLFVFPYVLLALSDPWRAIDQRQIRAAAALGAGPMRRLFRVKLPLLAAPLCAAAALGIAVSAAQFLPVLFMGAGRVPTLATEAVALAAGADRRAAAVSGLLLAGLPALAYGLALLGPALLFRHRSGMRAR